MSLLSISIINNQNGMEHLSIHSNTLQNNQITSTKTCQSINVLYDLCQQSHLKPIQITYPNFNIFIARKNNYTNILFYKSKVNQKHCKFIVHFSDFVFKVLELEESFKLNVREVILKYENQVNSDLHGNSLPVVTSKMPEFCKSQVKYLKTGLLTFNGRIFSYTRNWYRGLDLEEKKLSILLSRYPELSGKNVQNVQNNQNSTMSTSTTPGLVYNIDNDFRLFSTDTNLSDLKCVISELIGKSISFRKEILEQDNFDDEQGVLHNSLVAGRYIFGEVTLEMEGHSQGHDDTEQDANESIRSETGSNDGHGSNFKTNRESLALSERNNPQNSLKPTQTFSFAYNFGSLGVINPDQIFKSPTENYLEFDNFYSPIYMKRIHSNKEFKNGSLALCLKCDRNYVFDIFENVEKIIG